MNQYVLQFKAGKILEIGGGDCPLCDANGNRITLNMDVREGDNIDITHDLMSIPWPFEDASFDDVFAKYVLEHISWHEIEDILKEINRVLKEGGKIVAFVPNTLEQAKKTVSEGINQGTTELLFGSQEFIPRHIGSHKMAFNGEYAKKLFKDAGFNFVKTFPHPNTITDLIIEAYKIGNNIFERAYFDGEGGIGYTGVGYRDFTQHYTTARKIMELFPDKPSILEIGAARGYVTRILENNGIKSVAMDVSMHCYHTRATNSFVLHDLTDIPWAKGRVYGDKSFDLCFSQNVLEHIPEEKIDKVITEIARVSKAGVHGIHYTDAPYKESTDIDITHCTMHPKQWWIDKFHTIAPEYPVTIMYPRELENDDVEKCTANPPKKTDDLVKLNIGSFTDCFYYGWINIDIIELKGFAEAMGYKFQQHDITQGIPYEYSLVDIIMSNHLVEHLSREEGAKFLKECYRVLKPGGVIRISTPDAEKLSTEYLNGQILQYKYINTGVEKAEDKAEAYYNLLLAGHKTIYDEKALTLMLEKAGFKDVKKESPFKSRSDAVRRQTVESHPSLSLVLEAQK